MILYTNFAIISLVASVFKLLFSFAVGASLVYYVKYSKDEYSSSIRWSRTGGLREMIEFLMRSFRYIPTKSTMVLSLTIFAGFIAFIVSIILTSTVSRIDTDGDTSTARAYTTHMNTMDPLFLTVYMRPESTAEEALKKLLTDPHRNPNPAPRTRYTPRSFAFTTGCEESTALLTMNYTTSFSMPSTNITCMTYIAAASFSTFDWEPENSLVQNLDSNTLLVVAPARKFGPGHHAIEIMEPFFAAANETQGCFREMSTDKWSYIISKPPMDGIVTLPRTYASRCQHGVNGSTVISATHIQFAVNRLQDFDNVTASMLHDPDSLPLLKAMSATINNGIFKNQTSDSTFVTLIRNPSITTSNVNYLMCLFRDRLMKEGRILLCTYSLISATIVNPQTVDPTIEADLSRDFFHPSKFNTTSHLDFTIVHLPQTPESDINQGSTPLISATQLIKNNIEASRYLASLGYNVQLYTDPATKTMRLYILYDVVKIRDVYYVSDVAFGTMCALAVFFLIIWFFSEKLYPTVYNGTIYKTIYKELRSNDGSTQMLMCCTYDTLKFGEGYVVPDQSDKSSVTPEAYSQEPRMAAVNPLDDEPSQSHELQPLVLLDEIPAQSPLLSRWSMIVPTPTMSPAIVNTADAPPVSVTTSLSLRETQLQPRRDDNLGTPPPIPPRIPRQSYSNTVHREDEAIVPSTVQNVTFIQSPFE